MAGCVTMLFLPLFTPCNPDFAAASSRQQQGARMRMIKIAELFQSIHQDDSGQDLVEYALVLAAVAFAVVAGSATLGSVMANALSSVSTKIGSAISRIS
jgi:pilus assembly protein Flp/PilA